MDLEKLKLQQLSLLKSLNLKDRIKPDKVRYVAGIDLTYLDIWKASTIGIASLVVWDVVNRSVDDVFFYEGRVDFPYIPTFLAYRELPLILGVYNRCTRGVDAFMLDGMGIMHPRRMGIAAHFGIVCDAVSLGCAKSHLIGEYKLPDSVGEYNAVLIDGEVVGYVLKSKKNANPIFISPGNNITAQSALKLTLMCLNGYRLPEPTRLAHNFLQEYRRSIS
ncbi:endonuclease V [Hippea sp. KM1]|uniref:endonuclease V n=1 Tax=Hippea sp. KM1 TaxID=944481 RepID=UPI00046CFF9C|nr:endonuclease V [Hippea sp. KM1]